MASTKASHLMPRYARLDADGLHPFQREALSILGGRDTCRILKIEAPVGAGKSCVINRLLHAERCRPVIVTYPTKILINSQLQALRRDDPDLRILPWDGRLDVHGAGLVEYSGDSLLYLARQGHLAQYANRGELLESLLTRLLGVGTHIRMLTTPDVLHLVLNERYRHAARFSIGLKQGVFVFDEFHLYHDLAHFYRLLGLLLDRLDGTVVLLSATPLDTAALRQVEARWPTRCVPFETSESVQGEGARCFNHDLTLFVHDAFPTARREEEANLVLSILRDSRGPAAFICDSVFRLRHLARRMDSSLRAEGWEVEEWSGEKKSRGLALSERTLVLGTAAIEVGVNFNFRTLITEASAWASAVQRIGRSGRFEPATVHLITRTRFRDLLDDRPEIGRSEFENSILREVYPYSDPGELAEASEMFRGDSYPFALYDADTRDVYFGSEAFFSRYDILEYCDCWRCLKPPEKARELRYILDDEQHVEEILLRDRVFPLWSVLKGRLADRYERGTARYRPEHRELYVTPGSLVFYEED